MPISQEDRMLWQQYIQQLDKNILPVTLKKEVQKKSKSKKLDLHGLTVQTAFLQTNNFIENHYILRTKEIVIVCGKGDKIAYELPFWCQNNQYVRSVTPIKDAVGEHGAYLLKLRTS